MGFGVWGLESRGLRGLGCWGFGVWEWRFGGLEGFETRRRGHTHTSTRTLFVVMIFVVMIFVVMIFVVMIGEAVDKDGT